MSVSKDIITEIEGDLFKDAPENSVLIHSCNCQGVWGKGIAKPFKDNFPAAFAIYREHCQEGLSKALKVPLNDKGKAARTLQRPEGTALLIPPQQRDYKPPGTTKEKKKHWIACIFTSWHYGPRNRSSPEVILGNTDLAVNDLKTKLAEIEEESKKHADQQPTLPGELWGCRFNAGLFNVEWSRTRSVLLEVGLPMTIVKLAGEK